MIINIYALNIGVPNIIKHILLSIKGQIGPDIIIVMALKLHSDHQDIKSNKKILEFNYNRSNGLNRHLQSTPFNRS
jgi:hypothetical protein